MCRRVCWASIDASCRLRSRPLSCVLLGRLPALNLLHMETAPFYIHSVPDHRFSKAIGELFLFASVGSSAPEMCSSEVAVETCE